MAIGDVFEEDQAMGRIRNYFNDMFHANEEKSTISLNNLFKIIIVLVGISNEKFQIIFYSGNQQTGGKIYITKNII